MPTAPRFLSLLCALCSAAAGQPAPDAPTTATLDSIAPSQRSLVRARALHCYRMPDGSIWDGTNYLEFRKVLDHNLNAFDRVEPGRAIPGQTIVEDHVTGTVWKIKPIRETRAWGLVGPLGREDDGEIPKGAFEIDERYKSHDIPPLWSCAAAADYSWPFAFIDEAGPDLYTRQVHGQYLQISRDWGDGRFDAKGYSLDHGQIEGIVRVPDAKRWVKKDHFVGVFFLWPGNPQTVGRHSIRTWDLIPADEARISADDLADALLCGKASLVDWHFEVIKDRVLWKRVIRPVERAAPRPAPETAAKPPKPPIMPSGGPDLLILNDGRWFRGTIVRKDKDAVTIRTFVGQSEMEMTFKPDEVKEIQAPERR